MPANKPAVVNDHNGPTGCIVASKKMVDNQLRRKIWKRNEKKKQGVKRG